MHLTHQEKEMGSWTYFNQLVIFGNGRKGLVSCICTWERPQVVFLGARLGPTAPPWFCGQKSLTTSKMPRISLREPGCCDGWRMGTCGHSLVVSNPKVTARLGKLCDIDETPCGKRMIVMVMGYGQPYSGCSGRYCVDKPIQFTGSHHQPI